MNSQHIRLFLEHVLPWRENDKTFKTIVIFDPAKGENSPPGGNSTTHLSELAAMAEWWMGKNVNVMVVLSSQARAREPAQATADRKAGRWHRPIRGADNAVEMACLWADIDLRSAKHPNLPYTTRSEAVAALRLFCDSIKLPYPTLLMDSGAGSLHVYWRVDTIMPAAQWHVLASKLATAMRLNGLIAEKTADGNCSLRVPGSLNFKYNPPREVKMSKPGAPIPLATVEAALAPFGLRAVPNDPALQVNDDASAGIGGEARPVNLVAIGKAGCGVFDEAIRSGGKGHSNQLWNNLVYSATFSDDGEEDAHVMSNGYAEYDEEETQALYEAKVEARKRNPRLGWPTCESFSRESPLCKTCQWWGKIKHPFELAKLRPAEASPEESNDLPNSYGRHGVTGYIVGPVGSKKDGFTDQVIMPYQLRDARIAWDDDIEEEVLSFEAHVIDRWRFVRVPTSVVNSQNGLMDAIGKAGITCDPDFVKPVRKFFVTWVQKIMARKDRSRVHALGWNEDEGFSYNAKLYGAAGARAAFYGKGVPKGYQPKGDLGPWKRAAKFVTDQHRPALNAILASAFAGPLVKLSLDQGAIFSVWGSETGQGKSTTLKIAQAVWGDPAIGINGLDDTPNSILRKASDLRHLPMYWDELKTKDQYQKMVTLAFQLGQGKGKSRLGRNSDPLEVKSFSNMLTAVSNASLFNIVVNNTVGTEAGAMRIFEVNVAPVPSTAREDMVAVWELDRGVKQNYGAAGEVYAAYIGEHEKEIERRLTQVATFIGKTFKASSDERFWLATMSALIVGAELASNLDLCKIDVRRMADFLVGSMTQLRRRIQTHVTVMRTQEDGRLFLSKLLQDTVGKNLLVTDKVWDSPSKPHVQLMNPEMRLQNPWLQLGLEDNVLRMSKKPFKEYVDKQGLSHDEVIKVLTNYFSLTEKRAIGAGVSGAYGALAKARDYCWQVVLDPTTVDPSVLSASSDSPGPSTP